MCSFITDVNLFFKIAIKSQLFFYGMFSVLSKSVELTTVKDSRNIINNPILFRIKRSFTVVSLTHNEKY